jgi:repressor LexA
MSLHKTQEALLDLLKQHVSSPLTMREIQAELNISSTSVVAHHIQKLEQKGYLKRNPHNSRDYQILSQPEKLIEYLNLYGPAQCGRNGSMLDENPIDKIPIASKILNFPATEGFMVRAKGDSMEPDIKSGDLIIARKQNFAYNGDTIICVYEENVLVKRYFNDKKNITLVSNNIKHPPILVNDYFKIEGIVKNIIKYN